MTSKFAQSPTAWANANRIVEKTGITKTLWPSGGDDSAALQAIVTAMASTGGTIYFVPGKIYILSNQVTISSLYPINLIGSQSGLVWNSAGSMPCILVGATIAGSVIKYTAPVPGSRAQHGGGTVYGLAFIDPTGTGGTPGSRTVTAALELNDFVCSTVENCVFQWINGSAILAEFFVMSNMRGNVIRYCGAAAKPAVSFPSTSATFPAQSCSIVDNKMEVCHGAAYLSFGANSHECKISNNGFEADTANAPSNQIFLSLAGLGSVVSGNTFNRNTGQQLSIAGQGNVISGNVFQGGAFATTAVVVSGAQTNITGNSFRSSRTGYELEISGRSCNVSGNVFYASGAVRFTSASCSVSGNVFDRLTCSTLTAGEDFWISDGSAATGAMICDNSLNNSSGTVTTVGGIRAKSSAPIVSTNFVNGFAGTGNGAIGIRIETTNPLVTGNHEAGTTTLISVLSIGTGRYFGNYGATTTALPLTGSATFDPPSIAAGGTTTTTLTVTGAVVGDYVHPSFSLTLAGLTLTAYVSANNTVTCVFHNPTAGAIDLLSGTLKCVILR